MPIEIKGTVVSCVAKSFRSKKNGELVEYWETLLVLPNGGILKLTTSKDSAQILKDVKNEEYTVTTELTAFDFAPKLKIIKA